MSIRHCIEDVALAFSLRIVTLVFSCIFTTSETGLSNPEFEKQRKINKNIAEISRLFPNNQFSIVVDLVACQRRHLVFGLSNFASFWQVKKSLSHKGFSDFKKTTPYLLWWKRLLYWQRIWAFSRVCTLLPHQRVNIGEICLRSSNGS